MVGLRGIELNAKLLAQEAKIQYLDLKDLNFLLDVYDQPKLVLLGESCDHEEALGAVA
jgi:hypothetical protein